jgi:hypothetical protein
MEQELIFKGTPAQFGVAVNSFGERLFRSSGQPQLINVYPDPPPPTANPVTVEIYLNWKGPLRITAQSIPDGRSLLFLSIQDADWQHFTEYWAMLYKDLEQQGWFEAFGSGELKARDVQQRILEFMLQWEQTASGLQKNIIVGGVKDTTIAEQLNLDVQIVRDNLDLLQQRGCVLLKIYVTGPYRRVANLIALGRTIAREPGYLRQSSVVQVTNISTGGGDYVDTGGGDYAESDIDKRQGTTFVSGDMHVNPAQNRQELPDLEVADVQFELESYCGIAACLEVRNWTVRAKKVSVFVYPQFELPLVPLTGSSVQLNPILIDAEDTELIRVPLWLCRADPSKRPLIVSIEVRDALGRKTFATDEQIEHLNAQIVGQWPTSEGNEQAD